MTYDALKNFIVDVAAPYFYTNREDTPMAAMGSVSETISHITAIAFQAAAGKSRLDGDTFDEDLQQRTYDIVTEWVRDINMMWVDFLFVYSHHAQGQVDPFLYCFMEHLAYKYPGLECDGLSSVAQHLLSQREMNFEYKFLAGDVICWEGETSKRIYHRWLAFGKDDSPLDFRLKMWFGEGAPEGYITEESGYEYVPLEEIEPNKAEDNVVYELLKMNFISNPLRDGSPITITNVGENTIHFSTEQ